MNAAYSNIPFQKADELFEDTLYNDFVKKSIEWIQKSSDGIAFAQNYGSNWEAAYILEYLLDVRKIANNRGDASQLNIINEMCKKNVSFLIKGNSIEPIENWDGNTWDTSVVANALLYYVDSIGLDLKNNDDLSNRIRTVLPKVLKWLWQQFEQNESVYSQYCFGAVDYSRIIRIFIYVCKSRYRSVLLRPAGLTINQIITSIHNLAKHIDKEKTSKTISIYSESSDKLCEEYIVNWGDCFITAEVCNVVGLYLLFISEKKEYRFSEQNHDKWVKEIYTMLKKAMRWIEATQGSDGMWGTHDNTIRCLSSYLTTIANLKLFEKKFLVTSLSENNIWIKQSDCEAHKVFKAIRWLFDPKQRFNDGSYLHSSFLSVFFFESFVSIYNHWDFAKGKTMYKIYDEVFWMSPMRTTQERGKIVELEIDREHKLTIIKKLEKVRLISRYLLLAFSIISLGVTICMIFGLLTISIMVKDKNFTPLALIFTLIFFIFTTVNSNYFKNIGDK